MQKMQTSNIHRGSFLGGNFPDSASTFKYDLVFQRAKSVKKKLQQETLNLSQQLEHSVKYIHSSICS